MSKKILGIVVGVVLLAVVGLFAFYQWTTRESDERLRRQREQLLKSPIPASTPAVFKGKTVSEWGMALKSVDAKERLLAAQTFTLMGPSAEPELPALIEALKDPGDLVKLNVAIAIGNLGPKASPAIPALTELVSNEKFIGLSRPVAAESLGKIGPEAKSAIPALLSYANDSHPLAKRNAHDAIKKIDPDAAAKAGIP